MFVKQLTIFLENRAGSLEEVTAALKNHNVNILSLSLADTSEYGLLRLIVSDPELGRDVLKENGFSAMLTEVIAVKLENKVGMLQQLLEVIGESGLSIEYMYALASTEVGAMIIKTNDGANAVAALKKANMEILDGETVYTIR